MLDAKGHERGTERLIRLRWVASIAAAAALGLGALLRPGLLMEMTLVIVTSVSLFLLLPVARQARARGLELEAAELRARAQTSALEDILDNLGAMMMVLDDHHDVRWINRVVRQRFPQFEVGQHRVCYDPAEPIGGDQPPQCPTCRALESGANWAGEYSLAIPGGQPRVFRVYASRFETPGSGIRVVELIVDVTDEREAERSLREARKTAAIARLAAGVAHEMNTPLASLAAGLRSLRRVCDASTPEDCPDLPKHVSLIDDLAAETQRCQRVTESLLGYSREIRSRVEPVDLQAIVLGALGDLAARRALGGIEVVHEGPPAGTPAVRCDPDHLRLVLVNLLTNAVDSVADAGRTKGRVHVGVQVPSGGETAEIHVKDNGTGMDRAVAERAFDPFFTTKPVGQGTGLGLSVSRGLLESMGATIWVQSEPGRGADAVIRLRAHLGGDHVADAAGG